MALRKQIKELREKKKRYYLIFWPQEETYSIVQDSKVVEPKDPAVDDMVKVKEGGKVFVGKVAAVGSKPDVEARMSELEANGSEGSQAKTSEQKSPNEAKSAKSSKKAKPKQAKKRPRDKSEADTGKPPKKKKAEGNIIRIEGHDTSTQSSATTAQSLGGTAAQSSTTTSQSSGGTATMTSQSSGGTAMTTSQSSGGTATTTSQSIRP